MTFTKTNSYYNFIIVYVIFSLLVPILFLYYGGTLTTAFLTYILLAIISPILGSFAFYFSIPSQSINNNLNDICYERNIFISIFFLSIVLFLNYKLYVFANSLASINSVTEITRVITVNRYSEDIVAYDIYTRLSFFFVYPSFIYFIVTSYSGRYRLFDSLIRLLTFIFMILLPFMTGSKAMVVSYLIIILACYLMFEKNNIVFSLSLIYKFIFTIFIVFVVIAFVHQNRTNGMELSLVFEKIILGYIISPFLLFLDWFDTSCNIECLYPNDYGKNTFMGISKYFIPIETTRSDHSSVFFNDEYIYSNVYTAFRWLITDFGILLSIIFMFFIGFFTTFISYLYLKKFRSPLLFTILLALACFLLFSFFGSFYKYLTNFSILLVFFFFA
jgi:oligosaccharide repeat unit polymerase